MRRQDVPGTARFLTFSCYRRLRLLDNDRIKARFVACLGDAMTRHDVSLLAWVVMPEHVHLVVYREDDRPLGAFLQTLKDPFARGVLRRWRELDAPVLPRLRDKAGSTHVWQAGGGYDRNVVGNELVEKIRYVHRNPVRRGLVTDSLEWPWSSAAAYRALPESDGPPIAFDLLSSPWGDLT